MKICHVCYYNNSDATFRLLMSGKIKPKPGPVSASTGGKINCLVARDECQNFKKLSQHSTTNWQSVCNLLRFQGLVYAENSDAICVNETWLNQNIRSILALHYLGEIGLIEVVVEFLSQSKQPPSKLNRKLSCNNLRSFFAEITMLTGQRILFCFYYRPPSEDPSWMDVFDNFLHEVCYQFGNMVISGDFNLLDIL